MSFQNHPLLTAILSAILGLAAVESVLLLYYLSSWLTLPLLFGAGI